MSDEAWKALAGAFGLASAVLGWLLVRAKRENNHESRDTVEGRSSAVARVTDKLDEARREILAAIRKSDDDARDHLVAVAKIVEALRDQVAKLPRRRV